MFFGFLAFYGEFKPEVFSERYRKRFNLNDMTFKCIHENKKISIDDLNNDICDCCDGSDEVFNSTLRCKNTCPVNLALNDIKLLKDIYNKAIVNRVALGQEGSQLYKDLEELNKRQVEQRAELKAKLDNLSSEVNRLEKELRAWVFESNGRVEQTEEEKEAEMEEYVNKESNIVYKSTEDEEEGEDYVAPKVDEKALNEKKKRRADKWKYMKEIEYQNMFNNAINKFRESEKKSDLKPNDFLSRLLQSTTEEKNPPIYQAFLDAQKEFNTTSSEYSKVNNDVFNNEYRLGFDYGKDKQWYEAFGKTFEGKVSGSANRLIISMMHRASIRLPTTGCVRSIDYGAYDGMKDGLLLFNLDHEDLFAGKRTMLAKVTCYPENYVFAAYENTPNYAEAILGAAEACPAHFDENEFNDWLREIQYYVDDILNADVFENL